MDEQASDDQWGLLDQCKTWMTHLESDMDCPITCTAETKQCIDNIITSLYRLKQTMGGSE